MLHRSRPFLWNPTPHFFASLPGGRQCLPSCLSPNKTMDDWSKLVQQIACDDCTSTANYRLNQTVWSCWKCFPTWSSFLGTSLSWINLPIHLLHSQLVCQHMFDFVCVLSPFQNKQCVGIQPYGIVVDWQHKHILNLAKIGRPLIVDMQPPTWGWSPRRDPSFKVFGHVFFLEFRIENKKQETWGYRIHVLHFLDCWFLRQSL